MDAPHTNPLDYLLIQNAESGNLEAVISLIAEGANVNALNELHENALMCALNKKKIEVAIWLIENGADLTLQNAIGLTVLDYICFSNHPEIFQYIIKHQGSDAQHIINNQRDGHMFYYVVSAGLVNMVDFFIKNSHDWRAITDNHGRDILCCAINHLKLNKEKEGIYRLLSEMTKEERQETLEYQDSLNFGLFVHSFEQALECCIKNVSHLIDSGSLNVFVLKHLFPKELAAAITMQWLKMCFSEEQTIPVWYHHCIEKDFSAKYKLEDAMDIEEINKQPVLLFSQELQPVDSKKNTAKKQNNSMDIDDGVANKHSGCFGFKKPSPKCSIQ